jgi:hypothetical protein
MFRSFLDSKEAYIPQLSMTINNKRSHIAYEWICPLHEPWGILELIEDVPKHQIHLGSALLNTTSDIQLCGYVFGEWKRVFIVYVVMKMQSYF